jgi:hypothetical protein
MDNITAIRNFVVMGTNLLDIDRGGGHHYGEPTVLAVTSTLEEGFRILEAIGFQAGKVVEVVDPILINGKLIKVPSKDHPWVRKTAKKSKKVA